MEKRAPSVRFHSEKGKSKVSELRRSDVNQRCEVDGRVSEKEVWR